MPLFLTATIVSVVTCVVDATAAYASSVTGVVDATPTVATANARASVMLLLLLPVRSLVLLMPLHVMPVL